MKMMMMMILIKVKPTISSALSGFLIFVLCIKTSGKHEKKKIDSTFLFCILYRQSCNSHAEVEKL